MVRVINNYAKPVILDDGTILAASGTEGSIKEVKSLSDRDKRRLVEGGYIAVVDAPAKEKKEGK